MTTDTAVKYFDSTMTGAPALSNVAGTLISVLDACLVTGFGAVTVNSLVIADNVATGTVSTGHNFAMLGSTGPVIRIDGATPAALNGDWRIQAIPSSTQFTFTTTGIANQTATGTISVKRTPAGFSKAFSGTNKAAYRADHVQSNRLYLRVDDTGTSSARLIGYETMTDVDTGTGPFPTEAQLSGGGYIYKATGTGRPWKLYSDGQLVYLLNDVVNNAAWNGGLVFGDLVSYKSPDAFATLLIATNTSSSTLALYRLNDTSVSFTYLARDYTQLGASILSARCSHVRTPNYLGSGGQAYPCLTDNSAHFWPVEVWDITTRARGLMPGLWNPIHNGDIPHNTLIENIPQLSGRTIQVVNCGSASYKAGFDLAGPWR